MAGPTRPSTLTNTFNKRRVAATPAPTGNNTVRGVSRPPSRLQNESSVSSAFLETPKNHPKRPSSPTSNAPPSKRRELTDFDEGQSMVIDSKGTNIQVVVRCRGRSEREVRENSPVVVTATGGLRGKEITVSNGLASPMSNKMYTFDRVFGPEADQSMIYDDVVSPFLDEVRRRC